MAEIVKTKRKESLKDKLDAIEAKHKSKMMQSLYDFRLDGYWAQWEQGRAIDPEYKALDSGTVKSYYALMRETGRDEKSLKKWHNIYLKYPDKKRYKLFAEEKAKEWVTKAIAGGFGHSLVGKMTGNAENYTPKDYIKAVRDVLGGIDLDPASCAMAQKIVKAKRYYTRSNDGLIKRWTGRVFLNPPYGMPEIRQFTEKLLVELSKDVTAAILLTNDQTDTAWWQACARQADAICFCGRIRFYTPDQDETSPTNGQTFMYFGDRVSAFTERFSGFGPIGKIVG